MEKKDLMVYEIMAPRPQGLGIAQYNARIKELREQGYPIINLAPGHFRYVEVNMTQEQKLEELRKAWLKEPDPMRRKVIEAQGKALKHALELAKKDPYAAQVVSALL